MEAKHDWEKIHTLALFRAKYLPIPRHHREDFIQGGCEYVHKNWYKYQFLEEEDIVRAVLKKARRLYFSYLRQLRKEGKYLDKQERSVEVGESDDYSPDEALDHVVYTEGKSAQHGIFYRDNPEDACERGSVREWFLSRLSPKEQEVFELLYGGYSVNHIAEILRKKPDAVRKLIQRGKQKFGNGY